MQIHTTLTSEERDQLTPVLVYLMLHRLLLEGFRSTAFLAAIGRAEQVICGRLTPETGFSSILANLNPFQTLTGCV